MGIGTGVGKLLAYKVETAYGTAPTASGAQSLRRVSSSLDVTKETYQSAEIRASQQVADFRHGVRRVSGTVSGELSPQTYADWFGALLRRDFASVTAIASLSITIAAGSVSGGLQTYTVTRSAGSWLTDGLKVGDVFRLTAGAFNAANLNKNLFVLALTATVATVVTLNGSTLTAEGPIASATATVTGKKTFAATSAHTDKSFSIEHWFPEVPSNELFTGCKMASAAVRLPPTGIATVEWGIEGQNATTSASRYFTSPTASTATGVTAAVNGVLMVGGTPVAVVTGMDLTISGALSGDPVVGSNVIPQRFPGRVTASGNLSAYFDSGALRDAFLNETELSLATVLTTDNAANAHFISFVFPRIKLGGAQKNDGETGIVQSIPFTAIENTAGGAGTASEASTVVIQDSAA